MTTHSLPTHADTTDMAPGHTVSHEHDTAIRDTRSSRSGSATRASLRRGRRALEVEADATADDLLAGATGLAGRLTPTVAAARLGDGPHASIAVASAGRPLDAATRERLEHGFGADLAAIRIHDDSAAHAIADAEGVAAMAVGSHLYFAEGEYSPRSATGLHLLAHEVGHAIQQTGRRASDGRLAATDIEGSGGIQAADEFLDRFTGDDPTTILEKVTADHAGDDPAVSPIATVVADVAKQLPGGVDPQNMSYRAFVTSVTKSMHPGATVAELSYLLDVLKAGEQWEAAATLLDLDPTRQLVTAMQSSTFVNYLAITKGVNWVTRIVNPYKPLAVLRDRVYGAFRIFLVRPDTNPYRVSQARLNEAVALPEGLREGLVINERVFVAALQLSAIDQYRYALCAEAARRSSSRALKKDRAERSFSANVVSRGRGRALVTQQMLLNADAWVESTGFTILTRAQRWFKARAKEAVSFWDEATKQWNSTFQERQTLRRGTIEDDEREARARSLEGATLAAAKRAGTATRSFLAPKTESVPGKRSYSSKVDALTKVLEREIDTLTAGLSRLRLRGDADRFEDIPWLIVRLEMLRQYVRTYRPKDDKGDFDDTRQGHRLRVATEARRFAVDVEDATLEAACESVFRNEAGNRSRLVLISDWKPTKDSDPAKLMEDFPQGFWIRDGVLIRSGAVVDFYRARYMRSVADSLMNDLLPVHEKANEDTLLIKKAVGAANTQVPMPTRWVVEDFDWAPNANEKDKLADIIRLHDKSKAQLPKAGTEQVVVYPGQDVIASIAGARHIEGVFAWQLPDWSVLVTEIVDALSTLPEFAGVQPTSADPLAWLAEFARQVAKETIDGRLFTRAVSAAFREQADYEQERLGVDLTDHERKRRGVKRLPPGLLRAATNHDRPVVAKHIEKLLDRFIEDDDVTYKDGRVVVAWDLPNEALDKMHEFTRYAMPASENIAQTAALVIELASCLRAAFVQTSFGGLVELEETRYDIITGYFGFLLLADAWLASGANRRELRRNHLTNMDDATFEARRRDLAKVLASFKEVRDKVQRGQGFESTSEGGFRSLNYVAKVKPGTSFFYNDAELELVRILLPEDKQFRFHPEYGQNTGRVTEVDGHDGKSKARVLYAGTDEPIPPKTELFEIRLSGGDPLVVKAEDTELLDYIWRAVEERSFQLTMQNLDAAIVGVGSLLLDAAEFIPGAGQALAVGRIIASLAMFLKSADFDDIKAALTGEALEQLNNIKKNVMDSLSPDQIWMYLLFDADTSLVDRFKQYDSNSAGSRRLGRRRGKIGRLLAVARKIGSTFAIQFEAMRDRIQPPLRSTQSFVLTHPLLARGFALGADALRYGPGVAEPDKDIVSEVSGGFTQRIESFIAAIEGFELPDEIVPLDLAVDAVLGILLDRLGTKGKLANDILNATGIREEAAGMIADALDLAGLNPNKVWSGEETSVDGGPPKKTGVRPMLDEVLNQARADLLDGLYATLREVGLKSLKQPESKPIGTTTIPHPAENAASPAIAPGADLADVLPGLPTSGDIIPAGSGSMLPDRARADAEAHFGASFEDVRLHRSSIADGVDALTRGSHIVVRPDLSLTSPEGRHVVRHELAHVLASPTTGRGTSGPAVHFDPAAERAADEAAAMGRMQPHAPTGVASPALSEKVLAKVLDRLASYEDLRDYQTDVDAGSGDLPKGTKAQRDAIEAMRKELNEALKSATLPVSGVPPHKKHDTEALVREHAKSNVARRVASTAKDQGPTFDLIARRALVEVTKPKKGKKAQRGPRVFEFDPKRLAPLIEGYLLVRGGIQTNIEIDLKVAADPDLFLKKAKAGDAFDVKITGIFLGAITKASGLWKPILDTQLALNEVLTGTSHAHDDDKTAQKPHTFTINTTEDQTRLFHALVTQIRRAGPRERSLKKGTYAITDELLALAVDVVSLSTEVDPDQLPRASDYVSTRPTAGVNIGLRVGTHTELSGLTSPDRDSHHTTQFLFAEYFMMESDPKPFSKHEPGLEVAAGMPVRLHRADGKKAFEFAQLRGKSSERGGPMPAILIARPTHQRGKLHIEQSTPKGKKDLGSRSSQANTVDNLFRDKADDANKIKKADMPAKPGDVKSEPAGSPARERNEAVVSGVEHVYTQMRSTMLRALRKGLLNEEATYYEAIARRRNGTLDEAGDLRKEWRLETKQLERVHAAARENNDTTMAKYEIRVPS